MATLRALHPTYTASTWLTLWRGMFDDAAQRSGSKPGPPMTNAEVTTFVRAWRAVSGAASKLWAQFAARAYGWNPPKRNYLRRDKAQGALMFPVVADDDIDVVDVWGWAKGIATEMDARRVPSPRVDLNRDTFADPVFAGAVKAELANDGYDVAFKIPQPTCRDTKSGKLRLPRLPCDKDGTRKVPDGRGGLLTVPCDKPGDCDPVLIDDPVTATGKSLWPLALILGAVWLLTRKSERRSKTA